ncbi:MAG: hypothetical protein EBE86_011650 [Hormoscilla sp. GUM202]|nr:hypothetical protein [Hormoscilla sp. GUM202]
MRVDNLLACPGKCDRDRDFLAFAKDVSDFARAKAAVIDPIALTPILRTACPITGSRLYFI